MSGNAKPENLSSSEPESDIHVPDYVYDEIGPSFTPKLIIRKEEQQLAKKVKSHSHDR